MTEMVLPQFGMGMADGTIIAWHKAVGDAVVRGEPLCDVEAAKTTVEVGAPCDGFLQQILVPGGTNVPVNTVIAIIGDTAIAPASRPLVAEPQPEPQAAPAQPDSMPRVSLRPIPPQQGSPLPVSHVSVPAPSPLRARPGQGPQVEPRARRAARLHNIDLALIQGTGPGGRIVEEDIVHSFQSPAVASPASAMAGNLSGGVMHQLRLRCDAGPLASLLGELFELRAKSIPVDAALVRAAALAMAKAGMPGNSIGIRSDDGSIKTIENPSEISLLTIADKLTGTGESSEQLPALIIDVHDEDWLDEITRIDASGLATLSFGKTARQGDDAGEEWQVTFTCNEKETSISEAKVLLKALRDLLKSPVAILV